MRTIPLAELAIGRVFAHDLCGPDGVVVLPAGQPLSAEALTAAASAGWTALGLVRPANQGDEPRADAHRLAHERRATLHERERSRARASLRAIAEMVVRHRQNRWKTLPLRYARSQAADTSEVRPRSLGALDAQTIQIERQDRVRLVHRLFTRLGDGHAVGAAAPIAIIDELAHDARTRPEQVAGAALGAIGRAEGDCGALGALADQAYASAALCVLAAQRLGWSELQTRSAGLTGLLCDCGMTMLPHDVRHATRELTDVEVNAVHRHPAYSAALMELIKASRAEDALPESVQLAVYQHHERPDGTGYPHRLRVHAIHDLALLTGVVNTFLALCSPRAHRPALATHAALREVARLAARGGLSAEHARALIRAVGVYPPGTRVRLSTGHVAEVVGLSLRSEPDRPVVRVVAGQGAAGAGDAIDLAWWTRRDIAVEATAA